MFAPITRKATIHQSTCRGVNFPDVCMRHKVLKGVVDKHRFIWIFPKLGVREERE